MIRAYSNEKVFHKDGIESPNRSIQEKEKRQKERHVFHTLCHHHLFLQIDILIQYLCLDIKYIS